jgi:hypothetical protein
MNPDLVSIFKRKNAHKNLKVEKENAQQEQKATAYPKVRLNNLQTPNENAATEPAPKTDPLLQTYGREALRLKCSRTLQAHAIDWEKECALLGIVPPKTGAMILYCYARLSKIKEPVYWNYRFLLLLQYARENVKMNLEQYRWFADISLHRIPYLKKICQQQNYDFNKAVYPIPLLLAAFGFYKPHRLEN